MLELCSIASGSSGNCICVGNDNTHLLVDAGISGKRIEQGLNQIELKTSEMQGILITHEHSDHICGLGVLSRKYHIPIYATSKTIEAIKMCSSLGKIDEDLFVPIRADENFRIKDITIEPMHTSHDAIDPVAYRMRYENKRIAIATDLGTYNDYTVECLKGMDLLFLEANHDVNMLQVGPYPYSLKKRILGDRGHLSNELSGKLLCRLLHDRMQTVVLGHLSKENNLPELAFETVRVELIMADTGYRPEDFSIKVASRSQMSEIIHIA